MAKQCENESTCLLYLCIQGMHFHSVEEGMAFLFEWTILHNTRHFYR